MAVLVLCIAVGFLVWTYKKYYDSFAVMLLFQTCQPCCNGDGSPMKLRVKGRPTPRLSGEITSMQPSPRSSSEPITIWYNSLTSVLTSLTHCTAAHYALGQYHALHYNVAPLCFQLKLLLWIRLTAVVCSGPTGAPERVILNSSMIRREVTARKAAMQVNTCVLRHSCPLNCCHLGGIHDRVCIYITD